MLWIINLTLTRNVQALCIYKWKTCFYCFYHKWLLTCEVKWWSLTYFSPEFQSTLPTLLYTQNIKLKKKSSFLLLSRGKNTMKEEYYNFRVLRMNVHVFNKENFSWVFPHNFLLLLSNVERQHTMSSAANLNSSSRAITLFLYPARTSISPNLFF